MLTLSRDHFTRIFKFLHPFDSFNVICTCKELTQLEIKLKYHVEYSHKSWTICYNNKRYVPPKNVSIHIRSIQFLSTYLLESYLEKIKNNKPVSVIIDGRKCPSCHNVTMKVKKQGIFLWVRLTSIVANPIKIENIKNNVVVIFGNHINYEQVKTYITKLLLIFPNSLLEILTSDMIQIFAINRIKSKRVIMLKH